MLLDTDADVLKEETEFIEKTKHQKIVDLKKEIDDTSQVFATMLKGTLDKMNTRISEANKQWEEENDVNMLKHFENV